MVVASCISAGTWMTILFVFTQTALAGFIVSRLMAERSRRSRMLATGGLSLLEKTE